MRPFLRLTCLVVLSLALAARAWADETGSISGTVFDSTGGVVAGATVTVRGDRLPAGRVVTTGENGQYTFLRLLPGAYVVEVEQATLGRASRPVIVEVDRDTQLELVLGLEVHETLEVVGAVTPVVDLKSTEVNFNYKAEQIQDLPLSRSYSGLFQLIPGVADNNSFAPNGGASRQDNTYLLDGVNITNPGFGYLSTEVNEFDILEFNVKRGAITAEFGRASGFVTNAVTRSGTNRLTGGFRLELIPKAWVADSDKNVSETTDRWAPAFNIGGPGIADKLFWYGSGRFYRATQSDRQNNFGTLPDSKTTVDELFGKVTAAPAPSQFFNVGYRHRPSKTTNAGIGSNDSPDVGVNNEGTNRVATVTWDWFIGNRTSVNVKYLHLDEENESVALKDLGFKPAFDPDNLPAMGLYFDPALNANVGAASLRLNRGNYKRDEVKATLTQFFDVGRTSHQLKTGFGVEEGSEDLTRLSNGWGGIARVQSNTQVRGRYYPEQPSQISPGRTYSLFVQDDISIASRLVVNAGLLLNRDEFAQVLESRNTFLTFGFGSELQPRLGVNYQVRKDVGDKVYANYGRYFNLDMKSSSRSLAPERLFTQDATFDAVTGALISDVPGANTTGKVLDPDMDPPYTDEFLVGYVTPLRGTWSVDAFYMYRTSTHFIEDQPRVLPASSFWVSNVSAAKRKYQAFTVELTRRLINGWSANASYSWSRLEGNFDLDYAGSAVFNTSSILQDGPGVFVEDRYRYGPLSQDRTHVFKLFATWLPPQVEGLTLGGYLRVQSGTPWEARGRDWYNGYRRYVEPAGTQRNDVWPNVDFLASYRIPFGGDRAGLKVELRALNLFNTETALSVDQRQYLDGRIRYTSLPAGCDTPACATDAMVQGTTQPNPDFGQPNSYAPQRRFLLTFVVDFR